MRVSGLVHSSLVAGCDLNDARDRRDHGSNDRGAVNHELPLAELKKKSSEAVYSIATAVSVMLTHL
jgi:hypothetical protein